MQTSDEFHHVERASISEHTDVVYGNDAGVFEARENARFLSNSLHCIRRCILRINNIEDFKSNPPVQLDVFNLIDCAHASCGNLYNELVLRPGKIGELACIPQACNDVI